MADIANFIFELGAEELPAGQIANISNHIKNKLIEALENAEIDFHEIINHYTPRRLFWEIKDLNIEAVDKEVVIKGPPEKIAKSEDGGFTQAALGFAKKNNLKEKDLYFDNGYLSAKQTIKGRSAKLILEEVIPEIIANTPGTRFMRWADGDLKFARPLQWIVAVILAKSGKQVLDIEIEGLKASSQSYGHRFLGPDAIEIESSEQYIKALEKQGVYLDSAKRREKIVDEAKKLADKVNGDPVLDDDLLDEVVLITENPSGILCDFDKKFLQIPDCVLRTVMIQHQRYIPIASDSLEVNDGVTSCKLLPYFIAISNNPLKEAQDNIKEGNEKVIVPRFKDAEFFVAEDSKLKLEKRLEDLDRLNFLKGTMLQKAKRLEKISKYLIKEIKANFADNPQKGPHDKLDEKLISKAALLAKSDLSTNLVFEFTELQGEIGGVYAAKEGLDPVIVKAIAEHYRPRYAGDEAPATIGAKIIAIADKIDNLVAAFALGKIPSGSADPFALRRQANGLLEIVIHSHLIIDLDALVEFVAKLQKDEFGDGEMITKMKGRGKDRKEVKLAELNWDGCADKVKDFLENRLEFIFEIYHKDTDVNKAVLSQANPLKELNKRHMMIHLLYELKSDFGDFDDLVEAVSRVSNIAKDEKSNGFKAKIDAKLFDGDYEANLLKAVKPLEKGHEQNQAYQPVLNAKDLIAVIKPINDFFDNVMVNAEDKKLRENRKALVGYANSVFSEIGDFSML